MSCFSTKKLGLNIDFSFHRIRTYSEKNRFCSDRKSWNDQQYIHVHSKFSSFINENACTYSIRVCFIQYQYAISKSSKDVIFCSCRYNQRMARLWRLQDSRCYIVIPSLKFLVSVKVLTVLLISKIANYFVLYWTQH